MKNLSTDHKANTKLDQQKRKEQTESLTDHSVRTNSSSKKT